MSALNWKTVPGERGVYVRDYGDVQIYRLQGSHMGQRIIDNLGPMTLDKVKMIRETLNYNRKNNIPPFTYKDMIGEKVATVKAEKIVQEKQRKVILKEEEKRLNNTVSLFWENVYWQHRLELRRSLKENASIDGRWRNFIKPYFGEIPLQDLEDEHFKNFINNMRKRINPKTNTVYSDTTIHKCLTDLRLCWNYAVEKKVVEHVFPGKAITKEAREEVDNEKKCYLDYDEAKELADLVYERRLNSRLDHDTYCYTVLGLCLGLRAGDIHKLNQQAVERHIIDRTKNKRARFVHFGFSPVRSMLDERLNMYPPANPLEPLFLTNSTNSKGKMRTEVPHLYFAIIKELGFNEKPKRFGHALEKIDFHALRHTFATFAAMAGVDQYTLMKLMGHKKPDMTNRYIEIADAHQATNLERALPELFPVTKQEALDE
ncbi:tyrosine-type recombinase/integrase [Desulfovibrio litoralis]|uniref:Phage integrase family protein n=1 Tax=Desulfovibrio litoralis DSM 11393 TaxID=1121455 RepID=A0A1M7TLM6_9BACT|nr:tyrosine-type recombinase/integrase [Desulfovibrio litoralis]SHN71649.1 Phage integrase family protein [Desulfovibrio litoralis DSM 11393]